jgi:hypothetical protein
MKAFYSYQTGDLISGTYYGGKFSGTVTKTRPHSINNNVTIIYIALDNDFVKFPGTTAEATVKQEEGLALWADDSKPNSWGNLD